MSVRVGCNLCYIIDGVPNRTDDLTLVTIRNVDYLVCAYHAERYSKRYTNERYVA